MNVKYDLFRVPHNCLLLQIFLSEVLNLVTLYKRLDLLVLSFAPFQHF
jgi:hypothetical protein